MDPVRRSVNILELITVPPAISKGDYSITVCLHGQVTGNHGLPQTRLREIMAFADHFRALFLRQASPEMVEMVMTSVGIELFDTWLAPCWETLRQRLKPGETTLLSLRSPVPEIVHLPWELLLPPDGLPWGRDCNRCIRRRGGDPGQPVRFSHDLQHPPLQTVIHVATQHEDAHALRVAFQTMAKSITAPLSISVEPTGSFNGWVREVKHWQPHLVILQGTTMVRSGRGFFLFADEEGQADPKTGDEIMEQVLENTRVGCLIVCGRDLDHPPPWSATALLADDLARGGIPLTVAWPDRVHEGPGFVFLAAFLDALAHGATIDAALHRGGDLMARQANPNRQISWSIPMIFQ